ncbi:MAG: ArgE/DapE family deacylase [Gemmatimonadota bacterium]|nr:MAG: ArgE/DapE family deacylase [Gemmatimonadota bacterium]
MSIAIDTDYLTSTLVDLVRINSVNPSLVPGAPGESEIADYVEQSFQDVGLDVARHESVVGRPSVVGRFAGMGGGRSLMLNAHYDTVGVVGMDDPFAARIDGGRLYGRGAYDMKGSLAACMAAVEGLQRDGIGLAGDLYVAAVADEEHSSIGTAEVTEQYEVNGAIVTEPTELDVCLAHKGFVWMEVRVTGRAAHGSRPELGIDANMHMGRILAHLEWLNRELADRTPHRFVGVPSLHAALLSGGTAASVYAASCDLTVERRTVPGETEQQVVGEVQAILDELSSGDPDFHAQLRTTLVREPFQVSIDAPIVRHVERAVTAVTGEEPIHSGQSPWMDAALLSAAGVDTVVIGPAGAGAHSDEEWVDLESVEKLAGILAGTAIEYCG